MAIQGFRHTANFVSEQRPKNWREMILLLQPNGSAPLTALTSLMKSRSTDDAEFNWWDKRMESRRLTLGGNLAAGTAGDASTLTLVGGGLGVKPGDVLMSEHTGEVMRVTASTSATSISAVRGFAGTTNAAITLATAGTNPNLVVIGSVYEEGSDAPVGVNFDPTKRFNFTQIFRNTLEMTRTAMNTRLRTGDQVREAKRECLEIHTNDMERAFWLGQRWEGTLNGKPARTTGGVDSFIAAGNKVSAPGGALDMDTLDEYFYSMFKWGSSEKVGFAGNRAILALHQAIRKNSTYNIQGGLKEYGMNVTRITSPFGELVLKRHPLFSVLPGGVVGDTRFFGMDSTLYVLDAANLHYVYLKAGDTQYQKKLQGNGIDGEKSGYLTEAGIELHHPDTHFKISNLYSGVADS